jgi:hypothetical protein
MTVRRHHSWAGIAAVLLACGARAQLPPVTVLETSIETQGNAVHFPAAAGGRLILENCATCKDQALQLAPTAQFFINGQGVSLAQLRTAAAGSSGTALTVHYRLGDKLVTRIDLTVFK